MSRSMIFCVFMLVCFTGCAGHSLTKVPAAPVEAAVSLEKSNLTVYLVRHAEKESDGTTDPGLTEAGVKRAEALAALLEPVEITEIHSTDYRRTRDTIRLVAEQHGIENVTGYVGNDLAEVAAKIIARGGTHVVSGHSNTTGELAALLSGVSTSKISENEYDRLYIVTRNIGEAPKLAVIQYAPWP